MKFVLGIRSRVKERKVQYGSSRRIFRYLSIWIWNSGRGRLDHGHNKNPFFWMMSLVENVTCQLTTLLRPAEKLKSDTLAYYWTSSIDDTDLICHCHPHANRSNKGAAKVGSPGISTTGKYSTFWLLSKEKFKIRLAKKGWRRSSGKFLLFLGIAPCCYNLTGLTWLAQRDARLGSYRPVAALAITRVPQKPHNFGDMIPTGKIIY